MKKILIVLLSLLTILSLSVSVGCGQTKTNDIEKEDESQQTVVCEHEYEIIETVEATCNQPKKVTYRCKKCNKTYTETQGEKLGHTGEWVVVSEPTCYEDGREERICTRCQHKDVRIIPSLEHNYVEESRVEATCVDDGKIVYKCTNKGCDSTYEKIIPAKGHTATDEGVVHEPTCTEEGYTLYHCSVCDTDYKSDFVKATGHNMVLDAEFEATCEHAKGKKFICSNDNCKHVKYEYTGFPLPHTFGQDGKCTICGKSVNEINPLTLSSEKYFYERDNQKSNVFIYTYTEGVMNEVPAFNTTISKELVNQFIKDGFEGISIKFSRKTEKMATKFSIAGQNNDDAITIKFDFVQDTPVTIENVKIVNGCDSEWFNKGYIDADGFKVSFNYTIKFDKDNPQSYIDTERTTSWNNDAGCYETNYLGDYPTNCKFIIKKEYIDYVKSLGKEILSLTVKGSYTPGIDNLAGDVQGKRGEGIAEATFELNNIPSSVLSDGDIALLVYGNLPSEFKIFMIARKIGFDEDDPMSYIKTGSPYEYNKKDKTYERDYSSGEKWGDGTKFTINKEYIDYLKSIGATKLSVNVTGTPEKEGSPECIRIAKNDAGGTDLVKVPTGEKKSLTFNINDLTELPTGITTNVNTMTDMVSGDGDITIKIYNSYSSHFVVSLTTDLDNK